MMPLVLLFSLLCPSSHAQPGSPPPPPGPAAEELALLAFKSMLLSDGGSPVLASWNTSSHFCRWSGVACSRQKQVVALRLGSSNLPGRISPHLGNLSALTELDLGGNRLSGEIPPELGRLSSLRSLNLSGNFLTGAIPAAIAAGCTNLTSLVLGPNSLRGTIPAQIGTTLRKLTVLDLHRNNLTGHIPPSLGELRSMQVLSLCFNNLSGEIPAALGNLTGLQELRLHNNGLSGAIPSSLGLPHDMSYFNLEFNRLTGEIPASIWNLSSLVVFSVMYNMLSGTMPPDAFAAMPHLHQIQVNHNQLHGPFPVSIANASNISLLQLDSNLFSGIFPRDIGRLRNLSTLLLDNNLFEVHEPRDWGFITELTNCSQLRLLGLGGNKFGGVLPDSLSNLSTSLYDLQLGSNKITGNIPEGISNLINLHNLHMSHNLFTGSLPSSLGRLQKLAGLYVIGNKLAGPVPSTIGNLTELSDLRLDMNAFSGRIPSTLGKLAKLSSLGLSGNSFIGPIPSTLFSIQKLSMVLDLSHNNFEGSIPQEIGNLRNLAELHLESNKFFGEIPTTLGECQFLERLYLQNNSLNGSIPSTLNQLKGLQTLDMSSNNLSGQIPKFLGNMSMLQYMNLSLNRFVGEVPTFGVFANATATSVKGNVELCGGIPTLHLHPCSSQIPKRKHKLLVVPIVLSLITTLVVLATLYRLAMGHKKNRTETFSSTSMNSHLKLSYSQLVDATDGFSAANFLGSGSFGVVYKGKLQAGHTVAVKVLKLQNPNGFLSFLAECEALRGMRHRNLVDIITICSSCDTRGYDFKAIVYEFMPNGSLAGWLHPDETEQKQLNLCLRVAILHDVACALHYLHRESPMPIVHCDVKPSNVLLDDDMVAHVGDFGLARGWEFYVERNSYLQQSESSMGLTGTTNSSFQQSAESSMGFVRGTIGYAAPEYGAGNMVSPDGDIYSYGILVLETVTGKRPTDTIFRHGLRLREYVEQALDHSMMDVIDKRLEDELQTADDLSRKKKIDCLMGLLRLGICCSHETPWSRMRTGNIVYMLRTIKESLIERQ
ncbi:receptor kinase-like protein Xa21 [Hordeum vulgare subsp. vulgare]|uniref:Receptor kinase-like protein Xa21 n=1 Tax=Hordeum vulgare subsp. vulgare TaxID=112509 RepID=A0A8I6XU58_HORVV|nr:receptor kinase-like protein Xa21 [Hordeum vulgare subsp. vulgare]